MTSSGSQVDKSSDDAYVAQQIAVGEGLVVSGIVRAHEGSKSTALTRGSITHGAAEHLIEVAADSQVVKTSSPRRRRTSSRARASPMREEYRLRYGEPLPKVSTPGRSRPPSPSTRVSSSSISTTSGLDSSSLPQPDLDLGQLLQSPDGGTPNLSQGLEDIKINQEVAAAMGDELMQGFRDAWPPARSSRATSRGRWSSSTWRVTPHRSSPRPCGAASSISAPSSRRSRAGQGDPGPAEHRARLLKRRSSTRSQKPARDRDGRGDDARRRAALQGMSQAVSIDADAFKDAFKMNMTDEELTSLVTSMMGSTPSSLDGNLASSAMPI